jgi:hypothetical protein
MRSKNPYPGLLGKKVKRRQIDEARRLRGLGLLNEPPLGFEHEWQEKVLLLLCLHYDIDNTAPDRWKQLARKLAEVHVPAFNVAKKLGKKKIFGDDFVRDVEEIRSRGKGNKTALGALQKGTWTRRLREAKADRRVRAEQEKAERASREAFIREGMRALEAPPKKAANRKKRRN